MLNGDISNVPSLRLVWVFETTLGFLSEVDRPRQERALLFRRWKAAAAMWSIGPTAEAAFNDFVYRKNYSCDIVTYLPPMLAEQIKLRLEEIHLPFGNFIPATVSYVARTMSNSPSVGLIFDSDPNRVMTYGAKGRSSLAL